VEGERPLSTKNSINVNNVVTETTGNGRENNMQNEASVLTASS
jgi:hypothetical protein